VIMQIRARHFLSFHGAPWRFVATQMEIPEEALVAANSNRNGNSDQISREVKDAKDQSLKDESLVSIHAMAIQRLLQPSMNPSSSNVDPGSNQDRIPFLEKKLSQLKNRRISLFAQLEQARSASEQPTVLDELSRIRRGNNTRPLEKSSGDKRTVDPSVGFDIQSNLAERMYSLRKRRRIIGSHRIAGISILPCPDSNVLGIRLDICVQGVYVAQHHLFFDVSILCSMEESTDFQDETMQRPSLRLAQHTVPSGVPLSLIVDQTIGSSALIPKDDMGAVLGQVEECVGQIYDACYVYATRQNLCTFLKENTRENCSNFSFAIQHLVCSDSYESFQFELNWQPQRRKMEHALSCHISLSFDDPMSIKATRIDVELLNNAIDNFCQPDEDINGPRIVVEDSEADYDIDLKEVRRLLRVHTVARAISELVRL